MNPSIKKSALASSVVLALSMALTGCNNDSESVEQPPAVAIPDSDLISFRMIEGEDNVLMNLFFDLEITNNGKTAIPGEGWKLYYTFEGAAPAGQDSPLSNGHVDGQYFYFEPNERFEEIKPGETATFKIMVPATLAGRTHALSLIGWHFANVMPDGKESYAGQPVLSEVTATANNNPQVPRTTPETLYNHYKEVREEYSGIDVKNKFIPYPTTETVFADDKTPLLLSGDVRIRNEAKDNKRELNLLADYLRDTGVNPVIVGPNEDSDITLTSGKVPTDNKAGAYSIEITDQGITINGFDQQGVAYGVYTMRRLLQGNKEPRGVALSKQTIVDAPDLEHRGFFLDVARSKIEIETLRKTILAMSQLKMNVLTLGVSNDEAWRLEIPSYPELTRIGARNTHDAVNGAEAILPGYGATGEDTTFFYSRQEFIELLELAKENHIDLRVELNVPGHANALLRSLEMSGNVSLMDPEDKSEYRSVQGYKNNVINPCAPNAYDTIQTIVNDITSMYAEADVTMNGIHLGGDEVPKGAWEKSPMCQTLFNTEDPAVIRKEVLDLHYRKISDINVPAGTELTWWHEMSPHAPDAAGNDNQTFWAWTQPHNSPVSVVTPDISNERFIETVKSGHNVVIANSGKLYFDMPYFNMAEERGYYGGLGLIDTETTYDFDPFAGGLVSQRGMNLENRLSEEELKQIKGMQAQLWGEAVKSQEIYEYMVFPRLHAAAQRAWNFNNRDRSYATFSKILAEKELPLLNDLGIEYRVAPPGVNLVDGELKANSLYPGYTIRYTTDGSEPTLESEKYSETQRSSIPATGVKFRAFDSAGRGSATVSSSND